MIYQWPRFVSRLFFWRHREIHIQYKRQALLRDQGQSLFEGTIIDASMHGLFFQPAANHHQLRRGDHCTVETKGMLGEHIILACEVRNSHPNGGVGLLILDPVAAWESLVSFLMSAPGSKQNNLTLWNRLIKIPR